MVRNTSWLREGDCPMFGFSSSTAYIISTHTADGGSGCGFPQHSSPISWLFLLSIRFFVGGGSQGEATPSLLAGRTANYNVMDRAQHSDSHITEKLLLLSTIQLYSIKAFICKWKALFHILCGHVMAYRHVCVCLFFLTCSDIWKCHPRTRLWSFHQHRDEVDIFGI